MVGFASQLDRLLSTRGSYFTASCRRSPIYSSTVCSRKHTAPATSSGECPGRCADGSRDCDNEKQRGHPPRGTDAIRTGAETTMQRRGDLSSWRAALRPFEERGSLRRGHLIACQRLRTPLSAITYKYGTSLTSIAWQVPGIFQISSGDRPFGVFSKSLGS